MMKAIYCFLIIAVFLSVSSAAQSGQPTPQRPRVVVVDKMPQPVVTSTPTPVRTPPPTDEFREVKTGQTMSFREIKSRIAEARRELQSRPLSTASSEPNEVAPVEFVRIAYHDWRNGKIDFVVMSKEQFLSTAGEKELVSESGRRIRSRTIRGNGVNTPIVLTDENGNNHLPLMVQYPVIRKGKYIEMAYYMSTHRGLVTPEVVNAGRFYVQNIIELAREKLRQKGIVIQPKIADIAERLATVEHVDHYRFRTEESKAIFDDIYTLFALNEGQTYRYSVSSAGAGGMVQMIPSTYRMVRSWHPNVPLMPDFVEGMQNHVNAAQAMLLYMQRTWNDLVASETIRDAIANDVATAEQLMASGYNSNPARLAGYIKRGGTGWTGLIPRETKIYLSIYDAIERDVPMTPRAK
ncbi:MAG: hypothetical protein ACRD6X_09180 [Pyrinomonadaceae bacterium]